MQMMSIRLGQNFNKQNSSTTSKDKYCSGSRPQIAFKACSGPTENKNNGTGLKLSERLDMVSENSNLFNNVKNIKEVKILDFKVDGHGNSSEILKVTAGDDIYRIRITTDDHGKLSRLNAFKLTQGSDNFYYSRNEYEDAFFGGSSKNKKSWYVPFNHTEINDFVTTLLKNIGEKQCIPDSMKNKPKFNLLRLLQII